MIPVPLAGRVTLEEVPAEASVGLLVRVAEASPYVRCAVRRVGTEVFEVFEPGEVVWVNKALCLEVGEYLVAPYRAIELRDQ